ncbi:MAG: NAD-dependent succinate-semialdehyde dehydrogenase [Desulfovermiculus sp.]|nr:NAD-dependent succinate-semialdehyde dehydrogenase [Desulfovermiculus sp.]
MLVLADKTLLHSQAFINGDWLCNSNNKSIDVLNPATQSTIGNVPELSFDEINYAVEVSSNAFLYWRALTSKERSEIMFKWYEMVLKNKDDLATILTTEQGKPIHEAKGEIEYSASFIRWYSEEAKRTYGDTIPAVANDQRVFTIKEPIGVCAALAPWNFPAGALLKKIPPALAAGCTLVVKPSIQTPFTALAFVDLAHRAGIPAGVLNIVTGNSSQIANVLLNHPAIKKVSFTGSTDVGRSIYKQSAETIKKLSLELGGNAPFIIFNDADIDAAVEGTMLSKFRHTGQTCICANRIFVQDGIYDQYCEKLVKAVEKLKVGNGFDEGVSQGPLIDYSALEKVENHVKDAISKGAHVLIGGTRHNLGGTFYNPTVISDANESMLCFHEETFGPVAPLYKFTNEVDVIKLANKTPYGLASYIYSSDVNRIFRVSEALEYGMVGCNTGAISSANVPFGGIKESGFGKEGSYHGIDEYMNIKYICIGNIKE